MADIQGPSQLSVDSHSHERTSLLSQTSWENPDKHNEYLEVYQILSDDVKLKRTRKRTFASALIILTSEKK